MSADLLNLENTSMEIVLCSIFKQTWSPQKHWEMACEICIGTFNLKSLVELSPVLLLQAHNCPNKACRSHQLYVLMFHSPARPIELEQSVFCTLRLSTLISSYPLLTTTTNELEV